MGRIEIQRAGIRLSASAAEMDGMAAEFEMQNAIVIEQLLEPGLLRQVQEAVDTATFEPRHHHGVGTELCMTGESLAVQMLLLAANNPQLFRFVERVTGCSTLGYYDGRIYRFP